MRLECSRSYACVSSIPLAMTRIGAGEPLLLIHPLGADRSVWDPVLGNLSVDHDCVAVDMPGFGDSPELPVDVRATPTAIAASAVATLDALGLDSAHIAGISLGGWVALELGKTGRARSVQQSAPPASGAAHSDRAATPSAAQPARCRRYCR